MASRVTSRFLLKARFLYMQRSLQLGHDLVVVLVRTFFAERVDGALWSMGAVWISGRMGLIKTHNVYYEK